MATPVSVFMVLGSASLGGGLVRGVSGFGSAIIHTLVWIICTSAGVNGGTLQNAVVVEAVNNLVVSVPLVLLTKAWRNTEPSLAVLMIAMSAAFSPLGAAMLVGMNPHTIELVMAIILVVVIALRLQLHTRAWNQVRNWYCRARGLPCNPRPHGARGVKGESGGGDLELQEGCSNGSSSSDLEGAWLLAKDGPSSNALQLAEPQGGEDPQGAWLLAKKGPSSHMPEAAHHGDSNLSGAGLLAQQGFSSHTLKALVLRVDGVGVGGGGGSGNGNGEKAWLPVKGWLSTDATLAAVDALASDSSTSTSSASSSMAADDTGNSKHIGCETATMVIRAEVVATDAGTPSSGGQDRAQRACTLQQLLMPLATSVHRPPSSLAPQRSLQQSSTQHPQSLSISEPRPLPISEQQLAHQRPYLPASELQPLIGQLVEQQSHTPSSERRLHASASVSADQHFAAIKQRMAAAVPQTRFGSGSAQFLAQYSQDAQSLRSSKSWAQSTHDCEHTVVAVLQGGPGDDNVTAPCSDAGLDCSTGLIQQLQLVPGGRCPAAAPDLSHLSSPQPSGAADESFTHTTDRLLPPAGACMPAPAGHAEAALATVLEGAAFDARQQACRCQQAHSACKASEGCACHQPEPVPGSGSGSMLAFQPRPVWSRVKDRLYCWWCVGVSLRTAEGRRAFLQSPGMRRSLSLAGWGALAGAAAGIMSGLTGMGGPPLMLLYHSLNIDKMAVRGTNAWLGLVQPRIIAYAAMGALLPQDWPVYLTCAVLHVIGVVLGDRVAHLIKQSTFNHLLLVLMLVCVALLFFAAFSVGVSSGGADASVSGSGGSPFSNQTYPTSGH